MENHKIFTVKELETEHETLLLLEKLHKSVINIKIVVSFLRLIDSLSFSALCITCFL